jgi:hypothetical protein
MIKRSGPKAKTPNVSGLQLDVIWKARSQSAVI